MHSFNFNTQAEAGWSLTGQPELRSDENLSQKNNKKNKFKLVVVSRKQTFMF